MFERKTLKCDGCDVSYTINDTDSDITLIFIHGYGVDSDMWKPQTKFFDNKYKMINMDVRGHGYSRPCTEFTVLQAAEDLNQVIRHERISEFILIGLSMGGYIIQEYAYNYGKAKGYMITGSTPIFLPVYSAFEKWALKHSASLMNMYPWQMLKNEMTKACAITPEAQKAVMEMFDKFDKKEFVRSWDGIATCLREVNVQFDAPLLVGCGDSDKTGTIMKCMKFWSDAYPGSVTFTLKDASHVANLDNPEAFNHLLTDFIERCKSS